MSSSVHLNNKKKYLLILGESPTQGLYKTTLMLKSLGRNFV